MSSTDAERDDNRVPVTLAESSTTPGEWLPIQVNPTTGGLCIESST